MERFKHDGGQYLAFLRTSCEPEVSKALDRPRTTTDSETTATQLAETTKLGEKTVGGATFYNHAAIRST